MEGAHSLIQPFSGLLTSQRPNGRNGDSEPGESNSLNERTASFSKKSSADFKNEPYTGNHLLHKWSLLPFIYSFDRNVLNSDYVPNTTSTMTDTNGEQNQKESLFLWSFPDRGHRCETK